MKLATWMLLLGVSSLAGCADSQSPAAPPGTAPVVEAAAKPAVGAVPATVAHSFDSALAMLKASLADMEKIADYTCTLVKRERIDGKLTDHEFMRLKIRHQPFSVYIYCLGPAKAKGEEAIFVEGANDGNVVAHTTGLTHKVVGTLTLAPDSSFLMSRSRYPMTNIGMKNLITKLLKSYGEEPRLRTCEVQVLAEKVDGRACDCVEVSNVAGDDQITFDRLRIYFDAKHNIPLRFERYERAEDRSSVLVEEYTYQDVKLNAGLTDEDFSAANPSYGYN